MCSFLRSKGYSSTTRWFIHDARRLLLVPSAQFQRISMGYQILQLRNLYIVDYDGLSWVMRAPMAYHWFFLWAMPVPLLLACLS